MSPAQIVEDLTRRIAGGEFPAGQSLPAPTVLAHSYEATSDAVERALATLVLRGQVHPVEVTQLIVVARDPAADPEFDMLQARREQISDEVAALRSALADAAIMWVDEATENEVDAERAEAARVDAGGRMRATRATATVSYCAAETVQGIERIAFTKTWVGGLAGISEGTMLAEPTFDAASAPFVSFEIFHGTLDGHSGRIAFQQHRAERGIGANPERTLVYETVPGSGTGELGGISAVIDLQLAGDAQHAVILYRR